MCGIAGILKLNGPTTVQDAAALQRMLDAQIHRGPDDAGVVRLSPSDLPDHASYPSIVLGHRRLSIIDLSVAGRQPMTNENGAVWATYNGEIYNYRELRDELIAANHLFASQTDTEVIIHGYEEWGIEGLLQRLRGMFAFALYDSRPGANRVDQFMGTRLILARDRLGIKPLYYWISEDAELVAFASEVKALLKSGLIPSERDFEALVGYLLFGAVPSPLTTVKGIRSVPPGHYLVVARSGIALHQYWDVAYPSHAEHLADGESLIADLCARLEDAVERHLVSDVPIGVFLSGGIDSAGLVALARRANSGRLKTLTVVFDERELSEALEARQVAEHFHTDHEEVRVTSDDFMCELPRIFEAMDQPTNDGVNTYFVSKAARRSGLTVVLSGLGGDEVFWGYKHYRWIARRNGGVRVFSQLPNIVRRALLESASAYGRIRGRERWMRFAYLSRRVSREGLYLLLRGFFPPEQIAQLLGLERSHLEAIIEKSFETLPSPVAKGVADAEGLNYIEMKRYLHDQLLRDTDVFSMAHSVEVRVPYLDHMIVNMAANISPALKLARQMNKPLLVRAIGEPLLVQAGKKQKKGFSFPLEIWMKQFAGELEDIALGANVLDGKAVHQLWKAFRTGKLHWSRAWALVALGAKG